MNSGSANTKDQQEPRSGSGDRKHRGEPSNVQLESALQGPYRSGSVFPGQSKQGGRSSAGERSLSQPPCSNISPGRAQRPDRTRWTCYELGTSQSMVIRKRLGRRNAAPFEWTERTKRDARRPIFGFSALRKIEYVRYYSDSPKARAARALGRQGKTRGEKNSHWESAVTHFSR